MKIGIIGSADRAVAWEKHMGHHPSVKEVIIARSLGDIGPMDACVIIDDSESNLDILLEAVKKGHHSFLVSRLPRDTKKVKTIYHASEEANVAVQFSHWPTLSPSSKWMISKVPKPKFIQVVRELDYSDFMERDNKFSYYWVDELAFCIQWIDGVIHTTEVNQTTQLAGEGSAIHIFLRFNNAATANVYVTTVSNRTNHKRTIADNSLILDCDVLTQSVRSGQPKNDRHLFFKKKAFDSSRSAELSATQFLKAIQLNRPTPFGSYELLQTLKVADQIKRKLSV